MAAYLKRMLTTDVQPSISKLLLSTKQLTTRENISRRIADVRSFSLVVGGVQLKTNFI